MTKDWTIEKIFLLLAVVFGFLYVFILPPFQSVDENMHFFRAYQISQGKFLAHNLNGKIGDIIPSSLSAFYDDYFPFIKNIDKKLDFQIINSTFARKIEPTKTQYMEFKNTALYSPICYLSQASAINLGKVLSDRLAVAYYLGRLGNLLLYCLLVYLALRTVPFFKLPLFCLALMPMSLSLAGAYTCDVAVLGFNFLWIALLLKCLTNEKPLKFFDKRLLALTITAILIALSKSYILLLPLIFLLPISKFNSKKSYVMSILTVLMTAFGALIFWSFCIKGLTLNMNNSVANSDLQIAFIKSHPIQYIGVLIKTFFVKTPRLFITMIGVLGWQDSRLDFMTYIIYPFLIYFGIKADGFNFKLQNWQKAIIAVTILTGVIITYTSLYIMWTPVGNSVVLGLNGKYFIPLMMPLLLLFKTSKAKYDYNSVKYAIVVALILILASSELSLLHRFYNITPQLYYKV